MTPTKVPIILNAIAMLAYASVTIFYFLSDRPAVFGWIWAGSTVLWAVSLALSVNTYRIRKRTAEIYARIGRRWPL